MASTPTLIGRLRLAIIGLTDLYISERIQRDRYMNDVLRFRDDVLRNNIDVGSQSESSRIDKAYTDRRIRFEEEYPFTPLCSAVDLFDRRRSLTRANV